MNPNNPQTKERIEKGKQLGGKGVKRIFTDKELAIIDNAALQNCQNKTIAKLVGCDVDTLLAQYSDRIELKRAEFRLELHSAQAKMSKTNPVMAIFLGKNYLEQADKQEIQHGGSADLLAAVSKNRDAKAYYKRKLELLEQANKAGTAISEE